MNRFFSIVLTCLIYAMGANAALVPYPTEINTNSSLAYYRFGETSGGSLADSSGKNRSLVLRGVYARDVPELLFNAATADKATTLTNASASTASAWYSTTTGASVSMMIKFNSIAGIQTFFEAGTENSVTEGFHRLYYREDVHELKWLYNYANGTAVTNLASVQWTPVIGRTYHLAVTHDYASKTITFYLDGKVFGSVTHSVAPRPVTNRTVSFFSGVKATIDEFALFNGALPEARVKAQFAASRQSDSTLTAYYASPTGSIYGRGTAADPLDLPTLLNFGLLGAGDTAYLKAGIYKGIFVVNVSGAANGQIKIRSAIGETATLNGAGLKGNVITIYGSYVDVSHLIIRKTWAVRENNSIGAAASSILGEEPGESVGGAGVAIANGSIGARVYLNIIHDVIGDGAGWGSGATGCVLKQNLIFNNGWYAPRNAEDVANGVKQPNGHGVYVQNKAPDINIISDNIFFNAYGVPIKISGSGDSFTQNFTVSGNLTIGGGFSSLIGGSDAGVSGVIFQNNKTFGGGIDLGYSSVNKDIIIENNYLVGGQIGIKVNRFQTAVIRGNEIIGAKGSTNPNPPNYRSVGNGAYFYYSAENGFNNWTVNNNIYWQAAPIWGTGNYKATPTGGVGGGARSWATYKSETGLDSNSTLHAATSIYGEGVFPTVNKVFIEPQTEFEANRGRVIVYNWARATTQTVNLSTILAPGASYEIRSATNYFAGAIKSGTFSAANPNVTLPLTIAAGLPAQVLPYGDKARSPEPAPNFAAFLIIPTSVAAPPAPNN